MQLLKTFVYVPPRATGCNGDWPDLKTPCSRNTRSSACYFHQTYQRNALYEAFLVCSSLYAATDALLPLKAIGLNLHVIGFQIQADQGSTTAANAKPGSMFLFWAQHCGRGNPAFKYDGSLINSIPRRGCTNGRSTGPALAANAGLSNLKQDPWTHKCTKD